MGRVKTRGVAQSPEISRRVLDEIGIVARLVSRARFAFIAVTLSGAVAFRIWEGTSYRFWLLLGATALVLAMSVDERLRPPGPYELRHFVSLMLTAFLFQTSLIAVTGGIESPFLIIYLPPSVILAVGSGGKRPYLLGIAAPIAATVGFWWVKWAGWCPDLMPTFVRRLLAEQPEHYFGFVAFAVIAAMITGGVFGLGLRNALDRALIATEQARAEVLASIRERNRELAELLGALAHELKNPLACVQALSELVQRKITSDSKAAEQMAVLVGEVRRMGSILEEFLNVSRPLQTIRLATVDLVALGAEVLSLHEARAAACGVRLRLELPATLSLRGDERKLRQVLVNLVQNGLDASPRDAELILRGRLDDATVQLEVLDEGAGVPDAVRGRLFTPGITSKTAGSGLGLTIARAIVEQHDGQLVLEPRHPVGTCARVSLPQQGPAEPRASSQPEASPSSDDEPEATAGA